MKFKKLVSLGLVTVLAGSMLVGCSSSNDGEGEAPAGGDDQIVVTMITDVGGVNDQSFNQSAHEGLKKAEKELGITLKVLESKQDADYATNIEQAMDLESDLIIGIGFKLADAIEEASTNYPEQKFAIVDHTYENQPENVNSIVFNAQEAAYLVGLVAGKITETNKVGFIGGMEGPVIEAFEVGFEAGVKAVKPEAEVVSQYANSFTDAAKGKSIANQMHSNGVDIIFAAAGDVGTGAIEAAKENNKKAIGVDRDQNSLAPENVITSAMKEVGTGVYKTVEALVNGDFKGGEVTVYGLNEEGVGIAPTTDKNVAPDVLEFVKQEAEKIKSGEIKVPSTKKELEEMK